MTAPGLVNKFWQIWYAII